MVLVGVWLFCYIFQEFWSYYLGSGYGSASRPSFWKKLFACCVSHHTVQIKCWVHHTMPIIYIYNKFHERCLGGQRILSCLLVYGDNHPSLLILRCPSKNARPLDTHESANELLYTRFRTSQVKFHHNRQHSVFWQLERLWSQWWYFPPRNAPRACLMMCKWLGQKIFISRLRTYAPQRNANTKKVWLCSAGRFCAGPDLGEGKVSTCPGASIVMSRDPLVGVGLTYLMWIIIKIVNINSIRKQKNYSYWNHCHFLFFYDWNLQPIEGKHYLGKRTLYRSLMKNKNRFRDGNISIYIVLIPSLRQEALRRMTVVLRASTQRLPWGLRISKSGHHTSDTLWT